MSQLYHITNRMKGHGWIAENVEQYNAFTKRYNDLFGFLDILAFKPDHLSGCLGVQVSKTNVLKSHCKKSISLPFFKYWLLAGNRFVMAGYDGNGLSKKQPIIWHEVTMASMETVELWIPFNLG